VPSTEEHLRQVVADEFYERWNFPNLVGALDGKHITIRQPANSGSYYYNYKHAFSIVLLALVDADYKFLFVDVGTNGRVSDGGVFKNAGLSSALADNSLHLPQAKTLPGGSIPVPHLIVADDAFPLKPYIMKPYSHRGLSYDERIFNYRLSRARRIVENAFGIMANRFRVFMKSMALEPEAVELLVLASCSLHNFLRERSTAMNVYIPQGLIDTENDMHELRDGCWRQQFNPESEGTWDGLTPQGSNRHTQEAKAVRDELKKYFKCEGQVSWQSSMV